MTNGREFRILVFITLLCLSSVAGVFAQAIQDEEVIRTFDQVNPSERIELQLIGRIGRLRGNSEEMFGLIRDVEIEAQSGQVFVTDELAWSVKVFGFDGQFRRGWGRDGKGPGEFDLDLTGLAVARDTVVVSDFGRIHLFDLEGRHLRSIRIEPRNSIFVIRGVDARRDGWVVTTREARPDGMTTHRTYRLTPDDGIMQGQAYEWPDMVNASDVFSHRPAVVVTSDGFAAAPVPGYEIWELDRTGTPSSIHVFEAGRVEVTAGVIREFEETARNRCAKSRLPGRCREVVDRRLADLNRSSGGLRPVIGGLIASDDGLILVERADLDDTPFLEDGNHIFDLITVGGRWLGRVDFPERFTPHWLGREMIWGVLRDEYDVSYVVGYRFQDPS